MIASLSVTLLPVAAHLFAPSPIPVDDKALYMEHCASCHGETGDGNGSAELDRKARSFLDGGYSYGNTRKAVLRSVIHGIPGTPMPAFGETLPKDQLTALADYVIALGPPGTVVEPGSSVLTVGDRPLVVHGMMPALGEGGRREPRSVVVGFPNGTTFQYQKESAQLAAIRQGDFLDRQDWGGRGGAALAPLGQITWRPQKNSGKKSAKTEGQFRAMRGETTLRRAITGSRIAEDRVWLNFDVFDAEGNDLGGGQEFLTFIMVEGVPVAFRSCLVNGRGGPEAERLSLSLGEETVLKTLTFEDAEKETPNFTVTDLGPGLFGLRIESYASACTIIHAAKWTDALEAAVRADIQGGR